MSKNTSYDPEKSFESLLYFLEHGGPLAEDPLRKILAADLDEISYVIDLFIRGSEHHRKAEDSARKLKYFLESAKSKEDISRLPPEVRAELSSAIVQYLKEIANCVPENKRLNFYKSLIESIWDPYSSQRVGRQHEYRPSPITQPVSQRSGAQPQAVSTQHAYQQPQPTQPVSQPSGARPQPGGQYSQQSSVLTYQEFMEIKTREKSDEGVAKSLINRKVYLSDGREGRIVGYHKKPTGLYIYVEGKDETWYGLTLEDLKEYLEKSSGKSNRSYLILLPIALSGLLPLLFLRTPVSSLFLLPSRHHFLPVFILLLSLALFLLAKRALK